MPTIRAMSDTSNAMRNRAGPLHDNEATGALPGRSILVLRPFKQEKRNTARKKRPWTNQAGMSRPTPRHAGRSLRTSTRRSSQCRSAETGRSRVTGARPRCCVESVIFAAKTSLRCAAALAVGDHPRLAFDSCADTRKKGHTQRVDLACLSKNKSVNPCPEKCVHVKCGTHTRLLAYAAGRHTRTHQRMRADLSQCMCSALHHTRVERTCCSFNELVDGIWECITPSLTWFL